MNPTPQQALETLAQIFGIEVEELIGGSREQWLSDKRHLIMFFMHHELKFGKGDIKKAFQKDYGTIRWAIQKINQELEFDTRIQLQYAETKDAFYQSYLRTLAQDHGYRLVPIT